MSQRFRQIAAILLGIFGLLLWWWNRQLVTDRTGPIIAAVVVGLITTLIYYRWKSGDRHQQILAAWAHPSSRARGYIALGVGIVAAAMLFIAAVLRHRAFFPLFHDEFMYLLQARMLASGRLWLPAHPMGDFFETFFVLTRPVYAPIYFPGTALLNVPGIWLRLPEWCIPLAVAGATAGLLYLVVTEVIDGIAGLLAALLLISLPVFRGTSIMVMSHPVMALLGLAMIHAWLRWHERRSLPQAAIIGALAGWAAITRPADATAFAVAIGVGMLLDLRGRSMRRYAQVACTVVIAALPFLLLQIYFDIGVTGKPFRTPYDLYLNLEQPQSQYSFASPPFDPDQKPTSDLPEKQAYYAQFIVPALRHYRERGALWVTVHERLPTTVETTLPHPALLVLLCIGILGLTNRRRWIIWIIGPLLISLYSFNPIFLTWYTVPWMSVVIFGVMLGMEQVARLCTRQDAARLILTTAVGAIAIYSLVDPGAAPGENLHAPIIESLHSLNDLATGQRALVLFQLPAGFNFHQYPVFNIATASVDDARVIRARDLGPQRDRKIIAYYAAHQPDRQIITFDLGTGRSVNWGSASEALKRWPATPQATSGLIR